MTVTQQRATPIGRPLGLSEAEVAERRARGLTNAVPFETSRTYKRIIFENTFTFINTALFAICIALAALGLYGDAVVTVSLVIGNVVVGIVQETRAKRKLDSIALLMRPTATVIREGEERTVDPNDIVLDDILVVRPGDQILVDGEVLDENGLSVDESLLTGESDLIRKRVGDTVHSGSFCMTGSGIFIARKVGTESMAQQITAEARAYRDVRTPLQREVRLVLQVMLVLVAALSIQVGIAFYESPDDPGLREITQAAAVLVSLVPQGLVFMVTVTYAMAAVRMAGSGALIQRMNAVESTSNIDVLCLDKTGTLTTNTLVLDSLEPIGVDEEHLRTVLGDYAAATTAGNRTIAAIAAACPGRERKVVGEIPFSSSRKWSALAFDDAEGRGFYVLGAPEMIQPALRSADGLQPRVDAWTERGLRVLLFAYRPNPAPLPDGQSEPSLPSGLIPMGLIALRDELRPEARETIERFREAGITLKIISGDNPDTVAALARQAGFPAGIRAVSGTTLGDLDEQALMPVAQETTVFGRITPRQKERLVSALRAQGHYVAMTGDGVNDVLALKRADLAIAMRSGSQVTRSVADIVLLNDSFAALPKAFLEGQRIRRGMRDIIRLFLVRTLYVALIIFGTSAAGAAFPITPKHNSILALLTVGIPVFALAAWARPGNTPRRLVRSGSHFVFPAALSIAWVAFVVYMFYLSRGAEVITARSALTTITILCGLILIPFAQPPNEAFTGGTSLNGDWRPAILAVGLLGVYVGVLAWPVAREFYGLEVLGFLDYVILAHIAIAWAVTLRFAWRLHALDRLRAAWHRVRGR
ncbi:HAD-IC family P-type ATPase [Sphaerobacter thermophilus]|uniref:HAD-IC family P-type ATPase n=1 Tax=Sphaerobacter thermophilus TaxID=2057 RepID=UPI000DAF9B8D|nr:MAG: haloacid dehalogenase [Sphaerobacter thermophilus]